MKKLNNSINDIFFILFIVILFGGLIFRYERRKNILDDKYRYTVGITTRIWKSYNNRNIDYIFSINGVEFKGDFDYRPDIIVPDGRYLVKFAVEKPSINQIIVNCWVPHEINPPLEGWDTLPDILRSCMKFGN